MRSFGCKGSQVLRMLMFLSVTICSTQGIAQTVPWPIAGIPHDDSSIGGNYYDFRGRSIGLPTWNKWKGIFHHAVDIRAPEGPGTPVTAVASGRVVFMVTDIYTLEEIRDPDNNLLNKIMPDNVSYFHRIDVADLSDPTRIWAYLHVTKFYKDDDPQTPWKPGDLVTVDGGGANYLGKVAMPRSRRDTTSTWPELAPVHLSRRRYDWPTNHEPYAIGIQNPLELLDGYTDSHAPVIPGEHGTSEVKFRNNIQTGTQKKYFSKEYEPFWPFGGHYVISGQVDILANINDWTDPSWKGSAGPYKVGYQILREMGGGSTIPYAEVETFVADGQGTSAEAPTNDLVEVIYESSRTNNSVNSIGTGGKEQFIYIVTNTDQDGTIEVEDTLGCWNTASISPGGLQNYPDGNYRVRIFAEDISGNPGEHITESKWLAVTTKAAQTPKLKDRLRNPLAFCGLRHNQSDWV